MASFHHIIRQCFGKGTIALALMAILLPACRESQPEATIEAPAANTETPAAGATADNTTNVEAGEITGNVEDYIGRTVSVRGEAGETVGANAFTLQDDGLFGGEAILVLNANETPFSIPTNAAEVQVTGGVREFVATEIEQEYNLAVEDEVYAEYENRPVIIARSIAPAPDPGDVTDNPTAYYNQVIAVEADIEEFLTPGIFKLDEDQFFGGEGLIVLANPSELTEAALAAGDIEEGNVVVVTGVLRPFVLAEFERDYDFDWDEGTQAELEAEYENKPVLVANEIYPSAE